MTTIPLNVLIDAVQAMQRARKVMTERFEIPYHEIAALDDGLYPLMIRVESITKAQQVAVENKETA